MTFVFWLFIALILYCYFGYPLALSVISTVARRRVKQSDYEPTVAIVMSVYNEEDVVEQKITNLLALDYPKDKLKIFVGSDASDDRTDAIIKGMAIDNLTFIRSDERRGKMCMLNDLVAKVDSEVVLFCDARQKLSKNTIRDLVSNLSDDKVGCVSGQLVFDDHESGTAKGINLYWNYEKFIRKHESRIHSMLGATGAIYAIKRELYTPIPSNVVLDDMYVPLKIITKGYRAVYDNRALAHDRVANSPREEYKRKARTLYGNYQIFRIFAGLFVPLKSPIAFQFFSHKFLRVMVPFLMVAVFFVNFFLLDRPFYGMMFILQIVFYVLALSGLATRHAQRGVAAFVKKVSYVPYVFCLLNFSALIGFVRFVGSGQKITWDKARSK